MASLSMRDLVAFKGFGDILDNNRGFFGSAAIDIKGTLNSFDASLLFWLVSFIHEVVNLGTIHMVIIPLSLIHGCLRIKGGSSTIIAICIASGRVVVHLHHIP